MAGYGHTVDELLIQKQSACAVHALFPRSVLLKDACDLPVHDMPVVVERNLLFWKLSIVELASTMPFDVLLYAVLFIIEYAVTLDR